MKKFFTLLATLTLTLAAQAEDVKYLTFKTADGIERSLPLADGLTIRFADGRLVATAGDETFTADIADMLSMWFDVEPTAIENVINDDLAEGSTVRVYGMDGRLVKSYVHSAGTKAELPTGTYIIATGKQVAKVIVK